MVSSIGCSSAIPTSAFATTCRCRSSPSVTTRGSTTSKAGTSLPPTRLRRSMLRAPVRSRAATSEPGRACTPSDSRAVLEPRRASSRRRAVVTRSACSSTQTPVRAPSYRSTVCRSDASCCTSMLRSFQSALRCARPGGRPTAASSSWSRPTRRSTRANCGSCSSAPFWA